MKTIEKELRSSERKWTESPVKSKKVLMPSARWYVVSKIKPEKNIVVNKLTSRVVANGSITLYPQVYETLYALVVNLVISMLTLIETFLCGWHFKYVHLTALFPNIGVCKGLLKDILRNPFDFEVAGTIKQLQRAVQRLGQSFLLWQR